MDTHIGLLLNPDIVFYIRVDMTRETSLSTTPPSCQCLSHPSPKLQPSAQSYLAASLSAGLLLAHLVAL